MKTGFSTCLAKLVLILLLVPVSTTGGDSYFEQAPKWGFAIECEHIVKLIRVTVHDCFQQCSSRNACLSFNYNVRYKQCDVCANDDTAGPITRSPGGVYKRKGSMLTDDRCKCNVTEVCSIQDESVECRTKECQKWPAVESKVHIYGNRRQIGNHLVLKCPNVQSSLSVARVTCGPDGQWSSFNMTCSTMSSTTSSTTSISNPLYLGCFKYLWETLFGPFYSTSQTDDNCRSICSGFLTHSSAIYYGTQKGSNCNCFMRNPSTDGSFHRLRDDMCDTPCSGNINENCGGPIGISAYRYVLQFNN